MNIQRENRGSIVLVALCFVAVLGIALASYLAVSNQAMKLSNRAQQKSVSRQLAEMGLEQGLWSFNRNNWDSTVWTISGTTANRTISFPNTKYGNGVKGSIKIRVDNYDAYNRSSIWTSSPATNYQLGDLVSYTNGMWYRCTKAHTSSVALSPPNLAYWAEAQMPWIWSSNSSYKARSSTTNGSIVCYNSIWYLCINNPTFGVPPPGAGPDWKSISWSIMSINYAAGDFVFNNGSWYLCNTSHISSATNAPPNTSFWDILSSPYYPWEYRVGIIYNFNEVVYYSSSGSGAWYRCIKTSTSSSPSDSPDDWENALVDSWKYSSTISYNLNDVVYYSGSFYRCILGQTNQPPPNSNFWSPDPMLSPNWDAGRRYKQYDTVFYNGNWYLSNNGLTNIGKNPGASTSLDSNWILAPHSLDVWTATQYYHIGDTISYGGTWYLCITPHLNKATTDVGFWVALSGASYQWDPSISYTTTSYVSYGGVWYQCVVATTNENPTNPSYWKALGAPVIYAEGSVALPDGTTGIRTQLRALITKASLFPNAAAATSVVTISSAGTIDSYDASAYAKPQGTEQNYSYGQISSPFSAAPSNNVGYSAVLASTGISNPGVSVVGSTVDGFVAVQSAATSPFAPMWNYGGSAVLTGAVSGSGIDLKRVSRSPYIPQFGIFPKPDSSTAFTSDNLSTAFTSNNFARGTAIPVAASANTTLDLGTPGASIPSRYFYDGNLRVQTPGFGTYYKTININGPVVLYINGYIRIQPGGIIDIKSTGSAEIHCNNFRTYSGSDGVYNRTLDPKKLIVISDSSSASNFYLDNGSSATNPSFFGVLYAPFTLATFGLEIRTGMNIYGALSAKKISFDSGASTIQLHYDTSLRSATFDGVDTPFTITEWRELTDPAEKIVFP